MARNVKGGQKLTSLAKSRRRKPVGSDRIKPTLGPRPSTKKRRVTRPSKPAVQASPGSFNRPFPLTDWHLSPPSRGQALERAGKKRKSPEKKSLGLRDFGRKLIGKKKAKTKAGRAAQGALGTALGAAYGLRGGASGIIAGKLAEAIAKAPRTRGGIGPRPDRNAPRKPRPLIKPRKGPLGSITGIMPKKKSRTLVTSRRPPKR